ncbi:MAG: DUF58 domain-containing protein, partial [Myxococcota bacterium]|nr:DUF58 domain-containing protein [Myxococcota bacterium]
MATDAPKTDEDGYFDSGLLTDTEGLHLVARKMTSGSLAGLHRSPRRGSSIEFSEHKLYTPGDDIRHIDWRAFAKTDRLHVKQFEDETNLRIELLCDHSGSMGFQGNQALSKLDYSKTLAASLALLGLSQGDAVGLQTFTSQVSHQIPARSRSSHLMEILAHIASLRPQGETNVSGCLEEFARTRRRPAVTIMITDLFEPNNTYLEVIRGLTARRHDIALLHVLAPDEVDFPYENPAQFECMEANRRMFVHPRAF